MTAAVGQTSASPVPEIALTAAEQAWLDQHPVIRVAPDPNFAPIEWFNLQGNYSGVTAPVKTDELVAAIEKALAE